MPVDGIQCTVHSMVRSWCDERTGVVKEAPDSAAARLGVTGGRRFALACGLLAS
jgi:hypothetical protein